MADTKERWVKTHSISQGIGPELACCHCHTHPIGQSVVAKVSVMEKCTPPIEGSHGKGRERMILDKLWNLPHFSLFFGSRVSMKTYLIPPKGLFLPWSPRHLSAQISWDKNEHVVDQKEETCRAGPLGCSKSQWLQQRHHKISRGIWPNREWDLLCAHNLTKPQEFLGVALKGWYQHQLPLSYFFSFYCAFQFSVHRVLPGHERHSLFLISEICYPRTRQWKATKIASKEQYSKSIYLRYREAWC